MLQWLLRRSAAGAPTSPGAPAALDGASALAALEAAVGECTAEGATWPATLALSAWEHARATPGIARVRSLIDEDGPRGALSAAMGLAASGQRAAAFLSGPDLLAGVDLLHTAAGMHLPLVVHVACRAPAKHGEPVGCGHEAWHAAADTGCLMFFAANVQEAVDLALVARRAAEHLLVPVMVGIDGDRTAAAVQDLLWPESAFLKEWLGAPWDNIACPDDVQQMVFGRARRRIPRWYDADAPVLLGPLMDPSAWGAGAVAASAYWLRNADDLVRRVAAEFLERTGRDTGPLATWGLEKARIVLVAQGAAVETATAVARWAREHDSVPVGVVGLRWLRPFPAKDLRAALAGAEVVAVLERVDTPLAGEGPLLREVRAALYGDGDTRGRTRRNPAMVSAPWGLGGMPLRAADLLALVRDLHTGRRRHVYLGISFGRDSDYPKRQALMDTLRRQFPEIGERGLANTGEVPDVRPEGARTVALLRPAEPALDSLLDDAAGLVHRLWRRSVRSRPAPTWFRYDEPCLDLLTAAPRDLVDPGDDVPIDVLVVLAGRGPWLALSRRLAPGGAILLINGTGSASASLPEPLLAAVRERNIAVFTTPRTNEAPSADAESADRVLGALVRILGERSGWGLPPASRLRDARNEALADRPDEERSHRLAAFEQAVQATRPVDIDALSILPEPESDPHVPLALRAVRRTDSRVDALPRFWDHVGVLYRDRRTDELTPDPYLATGAVPALSVGLRDVSTSLTVLPVFDPETCDGDGRLWTTCPDGSVVPLVISLRRLLEAGIDFASQRGAAVDELRGVLAALARTAQRAIRRSDQRRVDVRSVLRTAFDDVAGKSDWPDERRGALSNALEAVLEEIGDVPLARTQPFFDDPEADQPGSGELFALFINPDACRCAELIVALGTGRGIRGVEPAPAAIDQARRLWALWERLPDTSGETIERARRHPRVGPLAAIMLSRHTLLAMGPAEASEPTSGAALVVRQALAVAEYALQPRVVEMAKRVEGLRDRLATRIREVLADALPTSDLEALAEGLDALGRSEVDVVDLASRLEQVVAAGRVDAVRLRRLVDCARGLADLHWRLTRGPSGMGRARFGVVIAADSVARWLAGFPYNPFPGPAATHTGGGIGAWARGLIEGALRQHTAAARLLRWASLELEQPPDADAIRKLDHLAFDDLTDEERTGCPPVFVVGDGRTFAGNALPQLVRILESGLPIKVLILSDASGGLRTGTGGDVAGAAGRHRLDLALLAALGRDAFVAQTSPAFPDHLADSILRAVTWNGPAVIHVHGPAPQADGFPPERLLEQADLAVRARAFPLFLYDPQAEGVFGSRLDLSANPCPRETWCTDEQGRPITPADWAAREARFAQYFAPAADTDPQPTPLADYLALPPQQRAGRTPVVPAPHGAGALLRVLPPMVREVERRAHLWRTLQELAGVVTPFTARVREQVEQELHAAHAQEIENLKADYEARLAELERTFTARAAERVTRRLMALAGYGPGTNHGKDGAS